MSRTKIALILIPALLIGLPLAELVREEIVYILVARKSENAHAQLETSMIKDQVRSLAGEPDFTSPGVNGEIWYWDAMNHQGALWKRLGLTWVKGHYGLAVAFDEEGKIARKWGGIRCGSLTRQPEGIGIGPVKWKPSEAE